MLLQFAEEQAEKTVKKLKFDEIEKESLDFKNLRMQRMSMKEYE